MPFVVGGLTEQIQAKTVKVKLVPRPLSGRRPGVVIE